MLKMKRIHNMFSMVQAITVLTILKMLANAQTTCNGGTGRTVYERLPDQQLQGFDDEVVRDSAPPFRVLEKCQDLCLRDRAATNNLARPCTSFDFQPGSRIASFSGAAEYEESTCYLTREQAQPEGIGNLMLVPNSVHFTEICLNSNRIERDCPNRRYVFERHPRKKLKLPMTDVKEVSATNRTVCEDRCLNEFSFVCRSATYDSSARSCLLSRFTRRTHPELLEDDPNSDYLENTCLNAERRCDGLAVFVKEENKRLRGPFEVDIYTNLTLDECQALCLRAEKYFCRSVEFDEQTRQCVISEEDSVSQKDDIGISSSPTYHFYDLVCLDNPRGSEYPDNNANTHLFTDGRRPDTAFQRYRNSRLSGEFHSEITGRSLSECLDECLRQTSFQCRSAVYSEHYHTCRLSRFNQRDGHRIIYDADYDYYENLMHQYLDGERDTPGYRPDPLGQDTNYGRPSLGRPGYTDDYDKGYGGPSDRYPDPYPYPDDRYPSGKYPGIHHPVGVDDRYPERPDRYPAGRPDRPDRYPTNGDRYPANGDRYPANGDRYPANGDRYPLSGDRYPASGDRYPASGDRYPASGDRYPASGDRYPASGDRYPPSADRFPSTGDRYPPSADRFPSTGDRYPPSADRFPSTGDRYPPSADRYPPSGDRYPLTGDRYPSSDRYPVNGDRYPITGGRYPISGDRYPISDRYPVSGSPEYPPALDRYPIRGDRYPVNGDNYPPGGSGTQRYPPISPNRYPSGPGSRYPPADRYPLVPADIDPVNRYPPVGGGGVPPSRYPDKDIYPNRDRYPGLGSNSLYPGSGFEEDTRGTKGGHVDRPYYGGSAPLPVRPLGYGVGGGIVGNGGLGGPYGDTGMMEGGYMPDGDPYASRPVGNAGGPIIGRPPLLSRCDEQENFRQVGQRTRVRKPFVRRYTTASTLPQCERECADARDFVCRSFNYRPYAAPFGAERDNCELSDRDSRDMDMGNPIYYDTGSDYDFYERNNGRQGADGECLDVSQVCSEDGMEFTLRTPEGFIGRIYTYGYYDRCFFRGNGGTVNVLRISGAQGYPECGTQRYGDTMTNIVVVQFSDYVQTGRDKRFNLTCLFRGPGEAVVTSGYIGAGYASRSGSPIPIEYLPAENTLSSRVRLLILYQGRPTTTIAVGDPLTFRLEAQDGYNYVTDIFATNVIARDPYSGRSVQLIDRYGCPVDNYVFPGLDRLRDGDSLEARFNAFKIPESNFLVFEATVRSCRDGCQPAYCSGGAGRSEPSFGKRRRRSVLNETVITDETEEPKTLSLSSKNGTRDSVESKLEETVEGEEERVREMIEVLDSRMEMYEENLIERRVAVVETICITPNEYYGLVTAVVGLVVLLSTVVMLSLLIYRKYGYAVLRKNRIVDKITVAHSNSPIDTCSSRANNFSFMRSGLQKPFHNSSSLSHVMNRRVSSTALEGAIGLEANRRGGFDPSEPIYTDPSLFEVARSSMHQGNSVRNENVHLI